MSSARHSIDRLVRVGSKSGINLRVPQGRHSFPWEGKRAIVRVRFHRRYTTHMTIKRLDHVSVVVDDLAAAIDFFTALGMTIEGQMSIEGPWVDRVNAIDGVQVEIAMMRTPDGHGKLELTKFRNPKLIAIEPAMAPPNALGLRSVMFTVESVDDTVARLRPHGGELIGEIVQYKGLYRLCYMRGPAGIIVSLAEELFKKPL
ncbi:MAG TPA: VOC family protein [Terriglobales bacterium]|nr:VOC family protein [Terriglobales bacterium]